MEKLKIEWKGFEKLPTYPSLKLTLTLTSHLGQNDGLGEGQEVLLLLQ